VKLEDAVAPLDYRYYGVNERLYARVHPYLSEAANLRHHLRVEAALAFAPRVVTVLMDQISEHQRDLSNMASARFVPEIFVGVLEAVDRCVGLVENTTVDAERMRQHLQSSAGVVVAEPLYILLALHGVPHAHELARRIAVRARGSGRTVQQVAAETPEAAVALAHLSSEQRRAIDHPESYVGCAAEQVVAVCDFWQAHLPTLSGAARRGSPTVMANG
jgi:adenylosuccinate lyase